MKVICKNKISKKNINIITFPKCIMPMDIAILFGGQITDNAWNQDIP